MFGSTMKVSEKLTAEQKAKVRGPGSMPTLSDKQGTAAGSTGGIQSTPKTAAGGSVGGTAISSVT